MNLSPVPLDGNQSSGDWSTTNPMEIEYLIFYLDGVALPHARVVHNLRICNPALKEQVAAVT